jgi:AraC-like DNA-binding protein
MVLQILSAINLAVAGAVTILVILLIMQKQRESLKFLIAIFYSLMGYGLMTGYLARSGLMENVPFLLYTTFIISFAHGPVLFLYTYRLLNRQVRFRIWNLFLFIPAAVMTVVIALFHSGPAGSVAQALAQRSPFPTVKNPVLYALCSLADFSVIVYLVLSAAMVLSASKKVQYSKAVGLKTFSLLYLFSAITYLGVLIGHMLDFNSLVAGFSAANATSALAYFLYIHSSPEITQRTLKNNVYGKHPGDGLSQDDENDLVNRIKKMMEEDRAYRDPGMTLGSLARKLGVSPNYLSFVLNERMGEGFRAYINNYRITEAKRELLTNKDASIIEIAFKCGFNSKTNFNSLFADAVGKSPSVYRKAGETGNN